MTPSQTEQNAADFKNLVDLTAVFAEAVQRLTELEAEIQNAYIEQVDEVRKDFADLQLAITESETALELLVRKHPEWFAIKKSVGTPYATIKLTRSTTLEVPNEEASILLIERNEELAAKFLRREVSLNIEALEELEDAELKKFRIHRVTDEKFSVKEKRIDLGKAVKAAVAKEVA